MVEKLALPFPLLSDPEGELARRCGVWNEQEGVAEPTIIVLDRSGAVYYTYAGGRDFSDRPPEDEVISALEEANNDGAEPVSNASPEIREDATAAAGKTVRPERPPMNLEQLQPYYLGAYFSSVALKKRLGENEAGQKVDEYREQVERHLDSIKQTAKMKKPRN